jgi:uncharacterized protein
MNKSLFKAFSLIVILALMLAALPAQSAQAISPDVVISQVYGGGGNSGATLKNDFIELYNRGASAVSLNGWSVQYAAAAGTSWQKTNLTAVSLAPGQYYLIQEAAGAGGTVPLPAPDAIGGIAMSATGAKVALVNNQTSLTGSGCPFTASVVDFVGYDGANCSETSPTPTLSNTTAAIRKGGGSIDTDNNSADFTVGAPTPRNTQYPNPNGSGVAIPSAVFAGDPVLLTVVVTLGSNPTSTGVAVSCDLSSIGGSATQALFDDGTNGDVTAGNNTFSYGTTVPSNTSGGLKTLLCTVTDAQSRSGTATIALNVTAILPIGTVNGPVLDMDNGTTHAAPYVGQSVFIKGVIYEKTLQATSSGGTNNGFFIQNTSTTADSNPLTSDGLFVFMGSSSTMSGPSGLYTPMVGDEVVISGAVSEFFNMTELGSPALVKPVVRSGVDVNAEVPPIVANPPANLADANRYWERLQGMHVQAPANSIVLGGRNVFSPADAEIWLARPNSTVGKRTDPYTNRAFRDAHLLDDNYDPDKWDGNGYRILIGSLGIKSAAGDAQALIDPARTFDTLTAPVSGGLNYTFNKYRIEVSGQPTFAEGLDPSANHAPQEPDRGTEYSIVDYNVENLYDFRDNPFSNCDFTGNTGCPNAGTPFLAAINPPYDYVPANDSVYQARLNDIATEIVNDLHSPDILMMQEVENQDICTVSGSDLVCGTTDNADGRPDDLQELALKIASLGGPTYNAAFDRDSSDLRGIVPSFMYRTDRVQLLPPAGDPLLGGNPVIGSYTSVPYDADVSNPKTMNAVYTGTGACETSWVFPRAPDIGLFRIYASAVGDTNYRDVYVIDNHFKSGPDTCVAHRTEQANFNAALAAYIKAANPDANIVLGGDLNVYPRPDDPFAPINQPGSSDQLGALYSNALGLKNLWEVELHDAPEAAYSYVFVGQAQTIDQVFVNQPMLAHLKDVRTAHINSDFPADYPGDVARGTSDHDPTAVRFVYSLPPIVVAPAVSPEPSIENDSATASATFNDPDGNSDGPFTCMVNYGDGSGDLPGNVSSSTCTGPSHVYSTFGSYTVTVSVTDKFGKTGSNSAAHTVIYNFNGFFQPVDNLPVFNSVKAGQGVPVKFSLNGDQGLSIFASGYPKSEVIACDANAQVDGIEETVASGGSSLSYDPTTDTYTYVWKTDKSWANSCRQLVIKFSDGTFRRANFKFTK